MHDIDQDNSEIEREATDLDFQDWITETIRLFEPDWSNND